MEVKKAQRKTEKRYVKLILLADETIFRDIECSLSLVQPKSTTPKFVKSTKVLKTEEYKIFYREYILEPKMNQGPKLVKCL